MSLSSAFLAACSRARFQAREERFIRKIETEAQTLREKAQEGDALALYNLGEAYSEGFLGMPRSRKIARQYYIQAYEKAVEQDNLELQLNAAFMVGGELWMQRADKARQELADRAAAAREKQIKAHEALIPDVP